MVNTLFANELLEQLGTKISTRESRLSDAESALQTETEKKKLSSLKGIITRNRAAIDALLATKEQIQEIATPEKQRDDYGTETWNMQFRKLEEIENLDGFNEEGQKLRMLLWSKLPNCRFKRFQELFCKPEDFCLPHFTLVGQTLVFPESASLHELSLAPVLVDIDRIPDTLLENLGIVTFDPNEKDPVKRLRTKADAIPRLKEIFESAEQLTGKNERVLVIRSAQNITKNIEEKTEGSPNAIEGGILYIRSDERVKPVDLKEERFPKRIAQYFPEAYGAQRKTFHQEDVYSKEIGQLAGIIVRLSNMNGELNRDWKATTPKEEKEEMRKRANELFEECTETLDLCENRFKVAAKTQLTKIQGLIGNDIQKAPNVSAAMTCMIAVKNALCDRHTDMRYKGRYNQDDRQGLEEGIQTHESQMKEYGKGIQTVAGRVSNHSALFDGGDLSQIQIEMNAKGILSPVHLSKIATIRLAPFVAYATRLRQKYDQLEAAAHLQDKEKVQDVLIQMHVIVKFLEVQKTFEKIKRDIMDPRFVSAISLRLCIAELNEVFSTFQIFPDRIVESYEAAYLDMKQKLDLIEARLGTYERTEMDITERTEMFGRLKDYLDSFDIPAIVGELE